MLLTRISVIINIIIIIIVMGRACQHNNGDNCLPRPAAYSRILTLSHTLSRNVLL